MAQAAQKTLEVQRAAVTAQRTPCVEHALGGVCRLMHRTASLPRPHPLPRSRHADRANPRAPGAAATAGTASRRDRAAPAGGPRCDGGPRCAARPWAAVVTPSLVLARAVLYTCNAWRCVWRLTGACVGSYLLALLRRAALQRRLAAIMWRLWKMDTLLFKRIKAVKWVKWRVAVVVVAAVCCSEHGGDALLPFVRLLAPLPARMANVSAATSVVVETTLATVRRVERVTKRSMDAVGTPSPRPSRARAPTHALAALAMLPRLTSPLPPPDFGGAEEASAWRQAHRGRRHRRPTTDHRQRRQTWWRRWPCGGGGRR